MTAPTLPGTFAPIDHLPLPSLDETPAAALRRIKAQAPEFREWFRGTGVLDTVVTRGLVTLPYPRDAELVVARLEVVPSSELTRHRFAPRITPTFTHGDLTVRTQP